MLFSSYAFTLLFLPLGLIAFTIANRIMGVRGGVACIVLISLVFYAMWDVHFVALLMLSVAVNFVAGHVIAGFRSRDRDRLAAAAMIAGITIDLGLLGWFKYAGFLAASINALGEVHLPVLAAVLPLGISFFTFEQIAYLVDVRRGAPAEPDPWRYTLFVVFFPRLVAGPILRYDELMPQIPVCGRMLRVAGDFAVGLTLFSVGLAKKTVCADGIAPYASWAFAGAASGTPVDMLVAWGGALAYAMQIYFDFSGYSDMAIGAARLFGLRFPMNFDSPYRASNIIEFWRHWHMTLSRFLRDYLYFSLGGNRRGRVRRYVNLAITMLLGGLWHGANWTFVIWGGLHGLFLVINHGWRTLCGRHPAMQAVMTSRLGRGAAWLLTMLAVLVAWVFFRAPDFATAWNMLAGMGGVHGLALPAGIYDALPDWHQLFARLGITGSPASGTLFIAMWSWGIALGVIAVGLPNIYDLMHRWHPTLEARADHRDVAPFRAWSPTGGWAVAVGAASALGMLAIARGGEFLYWQF